MTTSAAANPQQTSTNWKNVNNWHWVEKNCFPWAKDHIRDQLVGTSVTANGTTVSISALASMTGDADINQRKGKLITVYDVAFTLEWKGNAVDGVEAKGKIECPELMHDTDMDDLVTEVSVESPSKDKADMVALVKSSLIPEMKKKLVNFSKDMIQANGRDVHIPETQMSGPSRPPTLQTQTQTASSKAAILGGVKTLSMTVEFVCSAADLYETLLNPGRAAVWSRGPAQIAPTVGADVSLFGGNVTGKILELVPNKKIVQTWRIKTWPQGHFSTVTIDFEEQRESVKLKVSQKDVPIGEVDSTEKNWRGYYWNGIKSAFGYGAVGF